MTSEGWPSTSPPGSWARPDDGEILVSRTVKDLVVGSDLTFEDRGDPSPQGHRRRLAIVGRGRPRLDRTASGSTAVSRLGSRHQVAQDRQLLLGGGLGVTTSSATARSQPV